MVFAGAAAVTLAAAACGGSSKTSNGSSATQPPATTASAGNSASAPASAKMVAATETEFHIALSQTSLSPGSYTIEVANHGKVTHALEISGPGVSGAKTGPIQPGQSANVSVKLQAGTYDVWCPVPGHKQLGMNTNLTVGSGGA